MLREEKKFFFIHFSFLNHVYENSLHIIFLVRGSIQMDKLIPTKRGKIHVEKEI